MPKFNIDAVMKALAEHFDRVKTPIVDLIQVQTKDPFKVLVANQGRDHRQGLRSPVRGSEQSRRSGKDQR